MSDLESVDLSRDSDSETIEGTPTKETPPTQPPAPPKKSSMPSTPQHTPQRNASARLATPSTQNGTISPRRRLKERKDVTTPAPKPPAVSEETASPSKTASAKVPEAVPSGGSDPVQNAPPPKAKRGRPRKPKTPAKSDVAAAARPQATSKTAAATKTATVKTTAAKSAATATPDSPATQTNASKTATKPDNGEAPRPSARGRKRQLLTKPAETTNAEKTQEKTVAPGTSTSQEPPATQNAVTTQKRPAKAPEKRLHGAAAKAAASKRRREEEVQSVTPVSKNGPSRESKKDGEAPSPEVSEVPPSPVKKGRPTKRLKQQATRQVAREVIRIEDDDSSPERNTTVTPPKDAARTEEKATEAATAQNAEKVNKAAAAPSRGRQSLPAAHKQTAPRRRKTRDLTSAVGPNRPLDGPAQEDIDEAEEDASKTHATATQKRKESARGHALRKSRVVRHSTGNITPMEIDANDQSGPNANDAMDSVSNKEVLESMLDEIQRNAIPFLLKQDKICDSFSARMEKEVDGVLNNTASDVFQVFSDQVKDALVADRLRLAVASAKTELRRGIEKLLREFARKVGAPMSDENSSLLLRNEAFRSSRRFKEERRLSKPFAITSPRISKLTSSRRLMEENHDPDKAPHLDYNSDDADGHATTPRSRKVPLTGEILLLSNAADMKKFVEYSYENLDINCYRALTILKLCARPGGMTMSGLHEVTPLGLQMIRNKVRDLVDRGYLVEDIIRDGGAITTVYSTAAHVSEA